MTTSTRDLADLPEIDIGDHDDVVAAFRADPLRYFVDVHEIHGPVARARFGSVDAAVLSGLEANQYVFADADRWDYATSAASFSSQFGPTYLTSLNGRPHRDKRRRMTAGFRASVLAENGPLLAAEAERILDETSGSTVELRAFAQRLIIAMSGRAVLGRPVPERLAADIAVVERHLLSGRSLTGDDRSGYFDEPIYKTAKVSLVSQLEEIIRDRSWLTGTAETVLESLAGEGEETAATVEEIVADLFLLLSAGSETTSAAITWGLLFLAANPDWADRLASDLADWRPDDGVDIARNSSLLATVLETERLRPPLPLQLKVAAGDQEFGGVRIPAGTPVLHAACVTHQSSEIFVDPDHWRPERFLTGTRDLPARCLGTFGGTSHICLGLPLARLEQMIATAIVVTGWEIEIDHPLSLEGIMAPVLVPSGPVPARFGRRSTGRRS